MLSVQDLYQLRHDFRDQRKHHYLQEASLIASQSSSTALFNIAGMQQLIPYLSGQDHPLGDKLYNIQACVRINDLEEIGDDSHFTSFFMMGNRSLGDYFKQEAVWRSWDFLTQVLKLDPRKLAVTVYAGDQEISADDETAHYRASLWVPQDKISYLDASDNWRSPGPVGPCGPCTEIYYRVGSWEFPDTSHNVKENEDNRLEIRNNVFMEYYRDETWHLSKLQQQNVDTGMGFERLVKVLQESPSPYETELFQPMIDILEQALSLSYTDHTRSFRVILDHLRTCGFLISEGLTPSNEWRWYVLRKLLRAMYFERKSLSTTNQDFITLDQIVVKLIVQLQESYSILFPSLKQYTAAQITAIIIKEAKQFDKTLTNGQHILLGHIEELRTSSTTILSGEKAFKLYDTFGFPFELTQYIAKQHHISIDQDGFLKAFEQAKEQSRANTSSNKSKKIDRSVHTSDLEPTSFVGYDTISSESQLLKTIELENTKVLIFDKTPFYATRGGQIHDIGTIHVDDIEYEVVDVQDYNGIYLHFVKDSTRT